MTPVIRNSVFIFWAAFFCRCTTDLAGGPGSGSETTNSLTIAAIYSDGTAASGAMVRIRKSDYLSNLYFMGKTQVSSLDTVLDQSGHITLPRIDKGNYAVELNDTKGYAALIRFEIDKDISTEETLSKTGEITGSIDTIYKSDVLVQVYGIERTALVDSSLGTFTIPDMPEGTYSIRLSAPSEPLFSATVSGIGISEGTVQNIGIVDVSWPYAANIFLNTTQSGAGVNENLTGFPVLIRLDSTNFDFKTKLTNHELVFTNDHGDTLPSQVDHWDSVSQNAAIWVRIDTVLGNDSTPLMMFWGKDDINKSSSAAFDTIDGFQGVWHLEENGNEQSLDATINGYDGRPNNMTAQSSVPGLIGNGKRFSGDSSSITISGSAASSLNFTENDYYTLSAWVNTEILDNEYHEIISKGNHQYGLQINKSNQWNFFVYKDRIGWDTTYYSATSNSWTYITGVRSGADQYLYINGVLVDSTIGVTIAEDARNTSHDVHIGARSDVPSRWFKGMVDEVRISSSARSKAWIKLCYENQRPDQNMLIIHK